jgi:biopolymer transport protein ExbD
MSTSILSPRIERIVRYKPKADTIQLTSLMDVFTILVFYLLVNSGTNELLETPRHVVLPESPIEAKPRETVVIYVSTDEVIVQGEVVARVADILATNGGDIESIMARLATLQERVIGVRTQAIAQSMEVTILADKSVPFSVVRQVMSSATAEGYEKISLAVIHRASPTAQPGLPAQAAQAARVAQPRQI